VKILIDGDMAKLKEPKKFKCELCACVFEAAFNEYAKKQSGNEWYYSAKCPVCDSTTYDVIKATTSISKSALGL